MKKTLKIEGMMCGHCEMHIKKALEAIDGVTKAEVSHKTGTAIVTLEKNVSDNVLMAAVADQGYQVTGYHKNKKPDAELCQARKS